MMRSRFALIASGLAVIGLLASAGLRVGPSGTLEAQKAPSLTALDYEEIRNLYGRYTHAFDAGDGKALANTYTADGAFTTGGHTTQGREQLMAQPKPPAAGRPMIKHLPANIVIDPAPEGAKGVAYVFVLNVEAGKPPAFMAGGRYDDVIVKTSEGWHFKQRTFTPWSAPPAASF
jgi:SnoaL-like domain